jgi:hypothetical protein
MDFRTTWTTPAFGQTRIALTEPVPLAFADLSPPELNRVILGQLRPFTPESGRNGEPVDGKATYRDLSGDRTI